MNNLFTPTQAQTLRAALDRIIPADDYPSASDAGVVNYLSGLLSGELNSLLPFYELGLDCLNDEAAASHNAPFASLDAAAQDALLRRVEAGEVAAMWPISPAEFFGLLVSQTMEGYYSDPGNGANTDRASWVMVGFESREGARK